MLESVSNFSNKIPYNPLLGDVSQLKKDVFSHVYEKTVDIAHPIFYTQRNCFFYP